MAGAADPQAAASEDAALQGASGRHDGAAVGAAARARRRGLHWAVVPVLLVTAAAVGVAGARFLSVPSLEREYAPDPGGTRTIRLTVKGLRCVDTARQVSTLFEDLPGVVRMTAFAAQNRADVTFDPAAANVDDLVEAVSGPVLDPATGEFWYGRYEVVEVDGEPVVR